MIVGRACSIRQGGARSGAALYKFYTPAGEEKVLIRFCCGHVAAIPEGSFFAAGVLYLAAGKFTGMVPKDIYIRLWFEI